MADNIIHVDIYSDIACPWCYIGKHRFNRALSAFPQADQVEAVFRPYQLDPSLPDTPQPLKERLKDKFGPQLDTMLQRTASAANQEGLDLRFERAQAVNTLAAHRLLHLADQEAGAEAQRVLAEKLFEAYFTNGKNIADDEVLADLAVETGLDRKRVREYLASDDGLTDVQDEIARARSMGIRAVPTFVFDGQQAVQGAQPTSTFLQVLEEIHREIAEANTSATSADACAEGTCGA